MKHVILGLAALVASACTHFHGPGNFKTGSDYPTLPGAVPSIPALVAANSPKPAQEPFHLAWPVSFVHITQNFEPAKNPRHKGVDLGGMRGTPILAAHEGRVVYTGRAFHGYGNMVLVEYDNEWATLYAHLQKISVKEGQYLKSGAIVGSMGRTGHATGVHLHFELMHKKEPVNPLTLLDGAQFVADQAHTLSKVN